MDTFLEIENQIEDSPITDLNWYFEDAPSPNVNNEQVLRNSQNEVPPAEIIRQMRELNEEFLVKQKEMLIEVLSMFLPKRAVNGVPNEEIHPDQLNELLNGLPIFSNHNGL